MLVNNIDKPSSYIKKIATVVLSILIESQNVCNKSGLAYKPVVLEDIKLYHQRTLNIQ